VNDQLSLRRLGFVLRSDLLRSYRAALVISGTAALVALLISLATAYDGSVAPGPSFYRFFFIAALFAWGTIATSVCFGDLHGRATNQAFLLLPASALEKTLSRLLLHTVGLVVYLLVFTTVLSWVAEGINTAAFGVRRAFFSPLDPVAWMMLPHFLVTQALFFLGAAWFRKVQFVKTVGAAVAIVLGLSCLFVAIAWLFGGPWSDATIRFDDDGQFVPFEWLIDVAPFAYFYALPLFCWFVAWLRVTETQVSHGI
jgi:hypothetical protein